MLLKRMEGKAFLSHKRLKSREEEVRFGETGLKYRKEAKISEELLRRRHL